MRAFSRLVKQYRERKGLKVETEITVEMQDGDVVSKGEAINASFVLGPKRQGIVRINGFVCSLTDGAFTAIHEGTDDAYYTTPDDDAPYYILLNAFVDLPFPHIALTFGSDDPAELCMEFHPKAPWVVPTSVGTVTIGDHERAELMLTSDQETVRVLYDRTTGLIDTMEVEVFGGYLVQPGTRMRFLHDFTYEVPDEPLPPSAYWVDIDGRREVDHLASLIPEPEPAVAGGPGLIGRPAPDVVLSTLDNEVVDLELLRGQVVVLDFWATWCGPCITALPKLHDVARWADDESLPVMVLTVNTFERAEGPDAIVAAVRTFWQERRFTLPVLLDYTSETAVSYGVTGIPTTVVIRSDGVVHSTHVGFDPGQLRDDILAALESLEVKDDDVPAGRDL